MLDFKLCITTVDLTYLVLHSNRGQELESVSLGELIFNGVLHFLQTGRCVRTSVLSIEIIIQCRTTFKRFNIFASSHAYKYTYKHAGSRTVRTLPLLVDSLK